RAAGLNHSVLVGHGEGGAGRIDAGESVGDLAGDGGDGVAFDLRHGGRFGDRRGRAVYLNDKSLVLQLFVARRIHAPVLDRVDAIIENVEAAVVRLGAPTVHLVVGCDLTGEGVGVGGIQGDVDEPVIPAVVELVALAVNGRRRRRR